MLTIGQLSVALRKQCNCHPIRSHTLPQSKTNDCTVVLWIMYSLNLNLAWDRTENR